MKVLIIGGGGFVGNYVVKEISAISDVTIMEHPKFVSKDQNIIKADISNLDELKEVITGEIL